jgi:3-oxoacid CoA-transferase subunit A/glutaconate CoA-transferase subunit A
MKLLQEGRGTLLGWRDPDENRAWVRENKSMRLVDKRMSAAEAVGGFVEDGAFLALGGFGHIRVPMILLYETIRQRRRGIKLAGKTAVHDADLLIAAGVVDGIEVAYSFAHELRGLSPASRRAIESGRCRVLAELSNAAYQWRFLAGMMGLPFVPSRNMLGTDTLVHSSAKVVEDPWSGKPICLLPAAYPDVAMIHVHRCDRYGNASIDGILVEDFELARCARRLILSTEEIVDESVFRDRPDRTQIPYFLVDAVVEAPGGSHPCLMPYRYYFDEEHIALWLRASRTDEGVAAYFEEFVFQAGDFAGYLGQVGGAAQLEKLRRIEHYEEPLTLPWATQRAGGK